MLAGNNECSVQAFKKATRPSRVLGWLREELRWDWVPTGVYCLPPNPPNNFYDMITIINYLLLSSCIFLETVLGPLHIFYYLNSRKPSTEGDIVHLGRLRLWRVKGVAQSCRASKRHGLELTPWLWCFCWLWKFPSIYKIGEIGIVKAPYVALPSSNSRPQFIIFLLPVPLIHTLHLFFCVWKQISDTVSFNPYIKPRVV